MNIKTPGVKKKGISIHVPKLKSGDNFMLTIYMYYYLTVNVSYNVVISPFFLELKTNFFVALAYTFTLITRHFAPQLP